MLNLMKEKSKQQPSRLLITIIIIESICLIAAVILIGVLVPFKGHPIKIIADMESLFQQQKFAPHIPGLSVNDLVSHLEDNNFSCHQREFTNNLYSWQCIDNLDGTNYEVLIFSRNDSDVDLVDANVVQNNKPDDEIASAFLCQVATYPFDFGPKEDACEWISDTLPDINQTGDFHENEFEDIRYLLYGTAEARSLELGRLP